MKRWMQNVLVAAGLMLAFLWTLSAPSPRLSAGPLPAPQERREAFEDLRRAEQLLVDARAILAAAPGEYAGHRDKAIKYVDEALDQVRKSIEVARH